MEEALIKRVMPHSIEAEQSVVGAMLMDKDAILTAAEIVSGQDFYQTAYGAVSYTHLIYPVPLPVREDYRWCNRRYQGIVRLTFQTFTLRYIFRR